MVRVKVSSTGRVAEAESAKYALVAMAGTFDVLHRGHRRLLKQAFTIGRRVMIGVTTDAFARSLHKPHKLDPYIERKKELERLLSRWGLRSRAEIIPIFDRFGPAIRDGDIEALVVSRRTMKTAREINEKRTAKGLRPIVIDPIDLILAEDKRPISSTRIRRGRIDREGKLVH
jgi:cytidyltransferase-like protein